MMRLRSFVCVAGVVALLVGASDAAARTHRRAEPPTVGHAAIIGGAPAADAAFPWLAEMIDVRETRRSSAPGASSLRG